MTPEQRAAKWCRLHPKNRPDETCGVCRRVADVIRAAIVAHQEERDEEMRRYLEEK